MIRDRRFWKRVAEARKHKWTKAEAKALGAAIWGTQRRISDRSGHVRLVTVSGQHISPKRDIRREAKRQGLATTGRQWKRLRRRIAREDRELQRGKAAA